MKLHSLKSTLRVPELILFGCNTIEELGEHEMVSMGSSLKLCLVAEGAAHIYPRLGPTSEWDTAAAHAVVNAAGGEVVIADSDDPLQYNTKESLLNPFFIVRASQA